MVTTPIGLVSGASATALELNGKIVAAGSSYDSPDSNVVLVRYNPNGSLDTTFGGGKGITTLDFNNSDDIAHGLALDG